MKKFNFKNKREYLSKKRSSDAESKKSTTASFKNNLESNWKNYEEDHLLQEKSITTDSNFNALLENSSKSLIYSNNNLIQFFLNAPFLF